MQLYFLKIDIYTTVALKTAFAVNDAATEM